MMIVVCLLAGQTECQAGDEGNQTQINELTHENDTWVEKDASLSLNQGLEMPDILTTNSTPTKPRCEPPIYTVLQELGALKERLATTARALEETNKKLEASEKKVTALDRKVTELSAVDQGNKIYYPKPPVVS